MENKQLLIQYGPNSLVARNNPLSDVANIWNYKKKMTIIPNNREIIKVFESSINLFDDEEIAIFEKFKAHAEAFEMNQVYRMDSDATIQFPVEFERMIYREVDKND